jgi:hypothetical protein
MKCFLIRAPMLPGELDVLPFDFALQLGGH